MQWYYSNGGRQIGPISDEALQNLVNRGKIEAGTLVWNSTMTDWQAYGKVVGRVSGAMPEAAGVAGTQGESTCSECRKTFSRDDMIRYEDSWVCANCKPLFVQKLKEGMSVADSMEYAGFWIRFGAKFIDGIIIGIVNSVLSMALGFIIAFGVSSADPSIAIIIPIIMWGIQIAIAATYTTLMLGKYDATLGKMACKIKVITSDGGKVSYARALGRHFAEFLSAIILSIGYIIAAFDDQKRSLHDRICNTRVIKT